MMKILTVIILILCSFWQVFLQETGQKVLRGKAVDADGLPIENAEIVIVSTSGRIFPCRSESEGNFVCESGFDEKFTLVIEAQNFSILRQTFENLQDFPADSVFELKPGELREQVVVTAARTETRLGETPASVVTLSRTQIETTAAPTVDDALRQVAGFSLFRRTGSRQANPTTQGVSLRGVGASGASRSLVLFDGVPLNDSFGGWIQWSRVPTISIGQIEVLRGGASSLYGNNSLSGTVNILPRKNDRKYIFSAETYGGTQNTFSGSTFFGFTKNDWSADLVAAHFQTKGYITVDENQRGNADSFAGSRNLNLSARFAKTFGTGGDIFFRPTYFGESRTNGTPAQINRTHIRQYILGGNFNLPNYVSVVQSPKFDWRFYGGTQVYDQTFSAVSADRNSENLNRVQRVPAQNIGFSANFSAVVFENQTVVVGFESREVRGASDEIGIANNRPTSLSGSGGRERTFGVFVQDFARIGSKLVLSASARYDSWRNFAASSVTRTIATNQTSVVRFADRDETAFSPQISALYQITPEVSVFALASKSFRAPTLNELSRGFRVGSVVTQSNENLLAERAVNYEAGASYAKNRFYLRGNFFTSNISNPVSNVTLTTTPNLITRQRRNVGKIRARGAEIEAETRIKSFRFSAGYLFSDSRVAEFPANRALENLRVPQTARHQFTFQTNYTIKDWNFAVQSRASSAQFDDDLNTFRLEPYFQADAFVSKRFGENLQIFTGIENVFNSRYSVGRTPLRTVSSPINMRIGVRWN
jgi:outer membrane receptor protein involved in Fe transport